MSADAAAVVGLVTAPAERAPEIARTIVESHLAACVNIVPSVRSIYWWEGEIQDEQEALLVLKTTTEAEAGLNALLGRIHPYETFELVLVPVSGGNSAYLDWVISATDPSVR